MSMKADSRAPRRLPDGAVLVDSFQKFEIGEKEEGEEEKKREKRRKRGKRRKKKEGTTSRQSLFFIEKSKRSSQFQNNQDGRFDVRNN